jgi:histidine triad (HIT) family protein
MASIFSRIVAGELPCHKVAENEMFLAFLDIQPLALGHVLVIPKLEVDRFFDLPEDVLAAINPFAREVALKIERAVPCQRVGVAVIGLEVPHAHMHLVPLQTVADINFERPKLTVASEALAQLADRIRTA